MVRENRFIMDKNLPGGISMKDWKRRIYLFIKNSNKDPATQKIAEDDFYRLCLEQCPLAILEDTRRAITTSEKELPDKGANTIAKLLLYNLKPGFRARVIREKQTYRDDVSDVSEWDSESDSESESDEE